MSQPTKPFSLTQAELNTLNKLLTKGKSPVRQINHARILLLSHQGHAPQQVSPLPNLSLATVNNVRKRYKDEDLQRTLTEKARPGQPLKVIPVVEAHITSIACSQPPNGSVGWTTSLINQRLVQLNIHIDDESVRLVLKKVSRRATQSSPGRLSSGASAT